jgi:hypothetical protein
MAGAANDEEAVTHLAKAALIRTQRKKHGDRIWRNGHTMNGHTMNVPVFGATGMVGQGVLRECLLGRTATDMPHPRLREIVAPTSGNTNRYKPTSPAATPVSLCLGVSAPGDGRIGIQTCRQWHYRGRRWHSVPQLNPKMTFIHFSMSYLFLGSGDRQLRKRKRPVGQNQGQHRKRDFEDALRGSVYVSSRINRTPDGIQCKTKMYRVFYKHAKRLLPLLRSVFPTRVLTKQMGQAVLNEARHAYSKKILENGK